MKTSKSALVQSGRVKSNLNYNNHTFNSQKCTFPFSDNKDHMQTEGDTIINAILKKTILIFGLFAWIVQIISAI